MGLFRKHPPSLGVDYSRTVIIQDTSRWVIAQRDSVSIAVSANTLEVSKDNRNSWISTTFIDADKVLQGYVFRNGNICFFTEDNKIYLTDFNLSHVTEKTIFDTDGVTPYVPHTPADPAHAGWYYNTSSHLENNTDTDLYVFGNYANAYNSGAAPLHLVYTKDFGETFKLCYKFGQNPRYRDDGTASGGGTGTLLGDAGNTVVTRHIHAVTYCPFNDSWYCFTGDRLWSPAAQDDEIHWFKGNYTPATDSWVWADIDFGFQPDQNSRLKTDDGFFVGEYLYYGSDYTAGTDLAETGIFKVHVDDISDITKHQQLISLQDPADVVLNLNVDRDTGYIVATVANGSFPFDADILLIAKNYGEGDFAFKTFSDNFFLRTHSTDSEGFFRMDSAPAFSTLQGETFFIKIGDDLFDNIP